MNTAKLKSYAPQARKDFIAAVTQRANQLGIAETQGRLEVLPGERRGDVLIIAGREWPAKLAGQRERLVRRIQSEGFAHTMEAVAYTWFNRFAALRYMELHDYLGHGHRVLSSVTAGGLPDILAHATELAANGSLPGLDAGLVADLKLAGNKDGELYRLLLVAQCNALSTAMPFLFERIDDESELLLPDNLIRSDSLTRNLVDAIPEADWADIEIIGWLYQFYISEKKDQVIGKVVKSEDIPAATQLFTPNWIVKYMVQNSLGAQWLATYPASPLKAQMEYYIEPAEQTDEVKAQLAAITAASLDPEALTLIDPACGSGHILVEAYELFKAIYLERGYRQRDVPQLILEKNLFGLDIDERAAQLTGFALFMKGRADDRRLFERGVKLNVMALVDSAGFNAEALATGVALADYGLKAEVLTELKRLFEHATTFGSLIQVPEGLAKKLPALKQLSEASSQDLFVAEALERLVPLVHQAELLATQYDAVVANPPYMGSKGMNSELRVFAKCNYPDAKSDLFACFIERGFSFARHTGHNAMITMQSWMFLSSYELLRERLLLQRTIVTMAHLGAQAFGSISGAIVQTTSCVLRNCALRGYKPAFFRLLDGGEEAKKNLLSKGEGRFSETPQIEFKKICGSPIAYWVGDRVRDAFATNPSLGDLFPSRDGMTTGNNERFLRRWHEVPLLEIGLGAATPQDAVRSARRWFPCNKGGTFRRWYGNNEFLIIWESDGRDIKKDKLDRLARGLCLPSNSKPKNQEFYFRESATWTAISSTSLAVRWSPPGSISETAGPAVYAESETLVVLAFLCTPIATFLSRIINPTVNCKPGNIAALPWKATFPLEHVKVLASKIVEFSRRDWDAYERSWDFETLPLLTASTDPIPTLESSFKAWIIHNRETIAEMKRLEEENNRLFIDAYGLADEITPEVPIEQITLTVNPAYRYGGNLTEEEQWTRFRQDSMEELVSYAIGCMMGRYSLDAPGLIYAHSGNEGFDPTRYTRFPADADGIVPVTDELWFEDDAANRVREFLREVWGAASLEQNMAFLADNLGRKGGEPPDDTIRRYLADKFFKDHLQTYKKRPIYWMFSSGKQGAFQALVYLHRYHEGTLARMRAEYVVPLTGKIQSRIEMLEKDAAAASSTAARNKLSKQIEKLRKKHVELLAYDEKLRHHADMRIKLDLDDGVKVNYGKFGDLLAEVKAVTGGASDE
ncbi:SAM-dependent methyltransferase [Parazoarcus communis]|uniref:site-specific DNA-methyltransferase (adenine-specific) n=1 Tax=Parazoarcus communis TaxID=41977 RepID=A0A2U8H431_9RHOO|nr:BREX-1 system adenine-specific DNA-methyltransferase PglX [Parazoarcus communis]AWI80383.1 SAM-dependent methyltransferase [Parazoarcus communis]